MVELQKYLEKRALSRNQIDALKAAGAIGTASGIGALSDKKHPVRGAAIGAGTGLGAYSGAMIRPKTLENLSGVEKKIMTGSGVLFGGGIGAKSGEGLYNLARKAKKRVLPEDEADRKAILKQAAEELLIAEKLKDVAQAVAPFADDALVAAKNMGLVPGLEPDKKPVPSKEILKKQAYEILRKQAEGPIDSGNTYWDNFKGMYYDTPTKKVGEAYNAAKEAGGNAIDAVKNAPGQVVDWIGNKIKSGARDAAMGALKNFGVPALGVGALALGAGMMLMEGRGGGGGNQAPQQVKPHNPYETPELDLNQWQEPGKWQNGVRTY